MAQVVAQLLGAVPLVQAAEQEQAMAQLQGQALQALLATLTERQLARVLRDPQPPGPAVLLVPLPVAQLVRSPLVPVEPIPAPAQPQRARPKKARRRSG